MNRFIIRIRTGQHSDEKMNLEKYQDLQSNASRELVLTLKTSLRGNFSKALNDLMERKNQGLTWSAVFVQINSQKNPLWEELPDGQSFVYDFPEQLESGTIHYVMMKTLSWILDTEGFFSVGIEIHSNRQHLFVNISTHARITLPINDLQIL